MTTAALTPASSGARYQVIPIKQLRESPTNPRKSFGDMAEFTKNVTQHGILEPIIVRCVDSSAQAFEIVCGHRRYRAAKAAGFQEIPSIIRELGDGQVLEMQLVENCQRSDIHPMEEAEAYEALHQKHKVPIDDLAAKVGKSKAFVYARLKLLALVPEARKAFYEEKLNPSTALLVARIPKGLQEKALKEILRRDYDGELPSVREAQRIVEQHFMLRLADAPFKTDDATLLPAAGACSVCPKRTGNQKELFADIKSPDTCTDPTCFQDKKKAATARILEEAKKKGVEVLDSKTFDSYGGVAKGWVDLDESVDRYGYEQRKWRTVLGKHAPAAAVAVDPNGKAHHLVRESEARKVLREHKIKIKEAPKYSSPSRPSSTSAKADQAKRQLREKVLPLLQKRAVEKAETIKPSVEFWRTLAEIALDAVYGSDLPKRWGVVGVKPLVAQLKKMSERKARALFVDAFIDPLVEDSYYGSDYRSEVKAIAECFDIDLKKLEAEISSPAKPTVPIKIVAKKKKTKAKKKTSRRKS